MRRIYCVARNYAAHAREMGGDPERDPPFFFCKPADAVVPETWDCPRCGLPANLDSENPPPPPKIQPYKTHLAYVKERRSDAEAVAILSEALESLRARRANGDVIY